jgi:hypothetical protein
MQKGGKVGGDVKSFRRRMIRTLASYFTGWCALVGVLGWQWYCHPGMERSRAAMRPPPEPLLVNNFLDFQSSLLFITKARKHEITKAWRVRPFTGVSAVGGSRPVL